ncbi:hypothetical protein DFH06DRAFT_1242797 [Mycena polygramma]|nr:hypothetical protein DFH06DRAFT_1242797 [Mycena polygramma]
MQASELGRKAIVGSRSWLKTLVSEEPYVMFSVGENCLPCGFHRTIDGRTECRFAGDDNTYTASPFAQGWKYSQWIANYTQNVQVTRECYIVDSVSSPLYEKRRHPLWRTFVSRSDPQVPPPPAQLPSSPSPLPRPQPSLKPLPPPPPPPPSLSSATATVYRMTTAAKGKWVHWEEVYITQTRSDRLYAKFVDGSWYTARTLLAKEQLYKSVTTAIMMSANDIGQTYEAKLDEVLSNDGNPGEVWRTQIGDEEYRRNDKIRSLLLSDLEKARHVQVQPRQARGVHSSRPSSRMNTREFMPERMALQDTFWTRIRQTHSPGGLVESYA